MDFFFAWTSFLGEEREKEEEKKKTLPESNLYTPHHTLYLI
jgi:hypothetical protein